MPFFSKTRAGSILQRFSRDLWDVSDCNASVLNLSHRLVYGEPRQVLVTLHLSTDKAVCISLVTVAIYGGWPFSIVLVLLLGSLWKPVSTFWQCRSCTRITPVLVVSYPGSMVPVRYASSAPPRKGHPWDAQRCVWREHSWHSRGQGLWRSVGIHKWYALSSCVGRSTALTPSAAADHEHADSHDHMAALHQQVAVE